MELEVQLFAHLRDGRGKAVFVNVNEGAVVSDVIKALEIEENMVSNIMINDSDADFSSTAKEGDCIKLFPPLAGG